MLQGYVGVPLDFCLVIFLRIVPWDSSPLNQPPFGSMFGTLVGRICLLNRHP